MPYLLFGFLFLTLVWLVWAIVWAVALLFWPVALLIAGIVVWRSQRRSVRRWQVAQAGALRDKAAVVARGNGVARNGAFEAYRQETMQRLDEESAKFREFLQRLRRSRDKHEFDAFMSARRGRPAIAHGDASTA